MGRHSGTAKTGGRQKGSLNKSTLSAKELAEKHKCNPLEILFMFANGDWKGLGYDSDVYHLEKESSSGSMSSTIKECFVITPNMRLTAAEAATKYIFPQRKAVELSGNISTELAEAAEEVKNMSKEDKIKLLEEELKALKK